ncbi:uncharacterized protein LOC141784525 [Halichoeres trimaculatus]|uniref:uncharacterized protein LOC141784525 n=1 Tax=Halichoeres trimaculatus TaxID=147232 RepID=UPI003D9EA73E
MDGNQYFWILNGILLMLTCGILEGVLLQNVALHQSAVQSSLAYNGTADKAVDGNRNPIFLNGSCSHTMNESNPWWRVELQRVFKVTAVLITNRGRVGNRLNGAEVWIGLSLDINGAKNFRCGVIAHIPDGQTIHVSCSGMEARYVTVLLPGKTRVLTLCEVEVYPLENENLVPNRALRGEATQSSTNHSGDASKAIDGKRHSFWKDGSCTLTAPDKTSPWWRLDLKKTYAITSVKITNRGDCCAERLDGAQIRIGNSLKNNGSSNPRCATISHIRAGKTLTLYCENGSMEGRYVSVVNSGTGEVLSLCEVEVYAAPTVEPLANVALDGEASQSSTVQPYGSALNAINGDLRGIIGLYNVQTQCCSHTTRMANPWWRVDLLAVHKIRVVTIFNRQDCCKERLKGARILIGNSPAHQSNPKCGEISSVETSYTFHCGGMEGRYVAVDLQGKREILALAEVEVYASLKGKSLHLCSVKSSRHCNNSFTL